ncbi:chitinase [Rhyzopertha dominica]|nr:chitinase [Rhyzopertha dominica]
MYDSPVSQVRYGLVPEQPRKRCCAHCKWFMYLLVAAITTFMLATVLVALISPNKKMLYLKFVNPKEVPSYWVERAITYNTINAETNTLLKRKRMRVGKGNSIDLTVKSMGSSYKLVCYYVLSDELENLRAENIDPDLCTHINVAFATVINNTIYLDDTQRMGLLQVLELKKQNPQLKILLSIGGAGNDVGYPIMVKTHENRKTFIKSILEYIVFYKVDGVDLDWEFPNEDSAFDRKQKVHFTQLLGEIRAEINRQRSYKFLLSVAVAAPVFIVDNSYYVKYMNDYVDYINLMSYDFHFYTKYTPFTGINAPLYSSPDDVGYFAQQNINYSAHYWLQQGMERQKIIVGLPTYGHSFSLVNPSNNGINAPASGYGELGHLGFADFSEICWFLTQNSIKPVFDMESKSPYATKYNEWVSFDDVNSLTYKAEFIRKNFGGAMVLSLNTDDHRGSCSISGHLPQTFPLTKKIRQVLRDGLSLSQL